jgi:putative acetyltransferase
LGPVAVRPGFQRQGIGTALVHSALSSCRNSGVCFVVVLGDPRFYGRFQFIPARPHALTCRFGGGDAFQLLEFFPGEIPAGGGQVEYAPAFAIFDST